MMSKWTLDNKYKITGSYAIVVIVAVFTFLLFFADSGIFSSRSWQKLWNLGHIPLFVFIGYAVYRVYPELHSKPLYEQIITQAVVGFMLGIAIEFIQSFVHRQASFEDVGLDILGSLISVQLFSEKIKRLAKEFKYLNLSILFVIFIVLIKPLVFTIIDEYRAFKQYPILADFEYSSEITRWNGNTHYEISDETSRYGKKSLKVVLNSKRYSGLGLQYFDGDWSDYSELVITIFNPEENILMLTVSIFDDEHANRKFYFYDRYTQEFEIYRGWTELRIFLEELKHAPRKRYMDLRNIDGLRLFVVKPEPGKEFFIDRIYLEK